MTDPVPRSLGEVGARAARDRFDLVDLPGTTGFADARYASNGRRVQIKSASLDGGVVRAWRDHLRELRERSGSVVVVVVDRDAGEVVTMAKVSPSTLLDVGEFRESGQQKMKGRMEARIPWERALSSGR